MALTASPDIPIYTAAFQDAVRLKVGNIDTELLRIRSVAGTTYTGSVLLSSFHPVINNEAFINARGMTSSLMAKDFDNFLSGTLPSAGDVTLKATAHDARTVSFRYSEVKDLAPEIRDRENIKLFRASHLKYPNMFSTSRKSYFPLLQRDPEKDYNRLILKGQYIPISGFHEEGYGETEFNFDGKPPVDFSSVLTSSRFLAVYKDDGHLPVYYMRVAGLGESGDSLAYRVVHYHLDSLDYQRSKILYWINRYGVWDFYPFIDYEAIEQSDKEQLTRYIDNYGNTEIYQNIASTKKRLRLFGKKATTDFTYHLRDLVNAQVVIDETGTQVRVLDDNIIYEGEGFIEPNVTIEYLSEKCIS